MNTLHQTRYASMIWTKNFWLKNWKHYNLSFSSHKNYTFLLIILKPVRILHSLETPPYWIPSSDSEKEEDHIKLVKSLISDLQFDCSFSRLLNGDREISINIKNSVCIIPEISKRPEHRYPVGYLSQGVSNFKSYIIKKNKKFFIFRLYDAFYRLCHLIMLFIEVS